VAFGWSFVVVGAPAAADDPGRGASMTQRRGGIPLARASRLQTISSVIFTVAAQVASFAGIAYFGSGQPDAGIALGQVP
jgi:hypothetical protein